MRLLPGLRVGPYEVQRLLASGAVGDVYLARDARLGREVALKVLRPGGPGAETLLAEARAASALSHPAIATIYEAGEAGLGGQPLPYIAMELVDGPRLDELARAGAPLPELVRLVHQVAEGLAAAHLRGVVHRDVKPSNILVAAGGQAKLVDFGLALQRGTLDEDALETLAPGDGRRPGGPIVGTAAYMAPEAVRGEEVDGRSDVFSLGAVLYELLAGRRAFPGETVGAVLAAVLTDEPPPPSAFVPGVPDVLCRVVARMLEKDRSRRTGSMEEAARELAEARRAVAAGEGASGPAGGAAVAVALFSNISGRTEDDWLGTGLAEALTADLRAGTPIPVVPGERVHGMLRRLATEHRGAGEGIAEEAARRLGARWVAAGGFQRIGEKLRVTARLVDAGTSEVLRSVKADGTLDELFDLQDRLSAEITSALRQAAGAGPAGGPEPGETRVVAAFEAFARGLVDLRAASRASLERAIARFSEAVALDPRYATAYVALGWALQDRDEYAGTPGGGERGVDAFRRATELTPLSAEPWRGLAYAHLFHRRDDEALAAARRALELAPGEGAGHQALARVLFIARGEFLEAARAYETALALNPQAGWVALQLAHCLALAGELPRAEAVARRAIELQRELLSGQEGLVIVGAHVRLAHVHALQGRPADAVEELEAERAHLAGIDHALGGRTLVEVHARLGSALLALGREEEGRAALARAVTGFELRLSSGADDPFTRYYAACALARSGATAPALAALEAAAALRPALTLRRALVEPDLARVREEPGFARLLAAHRLSPA